jgi:hypothetical protein
MSLPAINSLECSITHLAFISYQGFGAQSTDLVGIDHCVLVAVTSEGLVKPCGYK